jgi:hypothetical protein
MFKYSLSVLFGILLCSTVHVFAQDVKLEKLWETTLPAPESVLMDPSHTFLYVSCLNGPATNDNKTSLIAQVGLDGKIINPRFAENLYGTKGMCILGDKLYVTEMTQIAAIDLKTGKVVKRYSVENAKFLNDMAVDQYRKLIYISDSVTGKIWVLNKKGEVKLLIDGLPLKQTNALLMENDFLLIGNAGDGAFLKLDLKTKKISQISKVDSGIDGITSLGNNEYILAETAGNITYLKKAGNKLLINDASIDKVSSADTDYNKKDKILYVPTLYHNTLRAFKLK